ncbi:MAG TPA: hypothetical protein VE714_10510 [Gemmatimonadales bacterium]|nr:hypothetical protein [Gemmatimonadales bacterium]
MSIRKLGAVLLSTVAAAAAGEKCSVNHNGHDICIAMEAVAAHIAHGDPPPTGSCETGNDEL